MTKKVKITQTVETKNNQDLIDQGICPSCFAPEITTKHEQRDENQFEVVSYCGKCGATFT